MFAKRILIAVPHPDDEVVACAATIGRARAQGAEVFALYLTHGCLARETLWPWERGRYEAFVARRRAEAEEVAKFLGITPVGWSPRPARHLWLHMSEVHAEIAAAIAEHKIDQLWVPAYEGGNADHDALNAIGSLFVRSISKSNEHTFADELGWGGIPPVVEFAEYNYSEWKTRAQEFPQTNGTELLMMLTPEEQNKKRKALAMYKSEKMNLNYVGSTRECCRPLAASDYSASPHEGPLWYTRFQWVPFRHPRVDFTDPKDVSKAIQEYLNHNVAKKLSA